MIKSLKLINFRQFENFELEFSSNLVVIHGDNTKGKSTLIEALYLICNGNSPWTSSSDDIILQKDESVSDFLRIEANISDPDNESDKDSKTYSYYQDNTVKTFLIDGHKTTRKKFFQDRAATIFSPEQIELLTISPQYRRDFLDKLIAKMDLDYEEKLTKFKRVLKQRNAYLKRLAKRFYETNEINPNDEILIYWTKEFAKFSSYVISTRLKIINMLSDSKFKLKYKPSFTLNLFEDMAQESELEKAHQHILLNGIKKDIATGYTNIGAHRDDWRIFVDKDVHRFGSRGEKRIAIGQLIFRSQELLAKELGYFPILLLDDIPSELDQQNVNRILLEKQITNQQTFITTIELEKIPKEILENAQIIDLMKRKTKE